MKDASKIENFFPFVGLLPVVPGVCRTLPSCYLNPRNLRFLSGISILICSLIVLNPQPLHIIPILASPAASICADLVLSVL
jgi:hypothetical protein